MSHPVADIFREVAQINRSDSRRKGQMLLVGPDKEILLSGDLHGRRMNLNKIITQADLGNHPDRLLILQELVHGPLDEKTGYDRSIELLMRAARLKKQFPEQVILLMSNHDLAQATGREISKKGFDSCKEFIRGAREMFGDDTDEIIAAMNELLLSQPMVVRCANGTFISHTLPSPNRMAAAGYDILTADSYDEASCLRGGAVYEWLWGRGHTDKQVEQMSRSLGVEFFLMGHTPTSNGWELTTPQSMIVMSDHQMGHIITFKTDEPLDSEKAIESLTPLFRLGR
jgi:hypothetical protein